MIYSAAKQFIQKDNFVYGPAVEIEHASAVTARHEVVVNEHRVPLGYLGYPLLLGIAGKLFGTPVLYFITPALAALALAAYAAVVRKIFGTSHALRTFILLFFLPSFLYFSIKGFWHNVPFVSLLILALYFGIIFLHKKNIYLLILSGLMLGLAISVRSNEIIWVAPLTAILLFRNNYLRTLKNVTLFSVAIFIALLPVFFANNGTYGHWYSFGYTTSPEDQFSTNRSPSLLSDATRLIVPKYHSLEQYQNTFTWYILTLSPLLALMITIGILSRDRLMSKQGSWATFAIVISIWLFWFYGGAPYYGSLNTSVRPIIGSSFNRYLLPAFIALLPFVSVGLSRLTSIVHSSRTRNLAMGIWMISFCAISAQLVITDKEGGLDKFINSDVPELINAREEIVKATEPNAVIIAGRKDKQFSQDRIVMGYNKISDEQLDAIQELVGTVPLYYNDGGDKDASVIASAVESRGFVMTSIGEIWGDTLFRIERKSE